MRGSVIKRRKTWSYVVDVVMRGLRHKLGEHASMIETLRGTGYRFRRA